MHVKKEEIKQYLDKFAITPIVSRIKEELNKDIEEEEILTVIKQMKLNTSPDGFTAIFYKIFKEELTPVLKELIMTVVNQAKIPATWSEAFITLIHKKQQDPTQMKSYRPISLLNEDYKIYAKLWANRLKKFLTEFIINDQSGFLPGSQLRDNVIYIINTIESYDKNLNREVAWFFY